MGSSTGREHWKCRKKVDTVRAWCWWERETDERWPGGEKPGVAEEGELTGDGVWEISFCRLGLGSWHKSILEYVLHSYSNYNQFTWNFWLNFFFRSWLSDITLTSTLADSSSSVSFVGSSHSITVKGLRTQSSIFFLLFFLFTFEWFRSHSLYANHTWTWMTANTASINSTSDLNSVFKLRANYLACLLEYLKCIKNATNPKPGFEHFCQNVLSSQTSSS